MTMQPPESTPPQAVQPSPAGWYLDHSVGMNRYWDGVHWTAHTAPMAPSGQQPYYGSPIVQPNTMTPGSFAQSGAREYTVRPYNQRMAARVARRAHVYGEGAVAVAFTFNNLATMVTLGLIEDTAKFIPVIGSFADLAFSILGFYFHRIVLVTDQNVYVFRDWPFHIPGKLLMKQERRPGVVQLGVPTASAFMRFIRRGQLTFHDGTIVFHTVVFIRRAQYIAQEANLPAGQ